jgi:serine/threonine-protein kinase HipA
MKIGGEYRLRDIGISEWRKLVREVRLDADALIGRIAAMADRLLDELSTVCARARGEGLDQPIIERLAARIAERARVCGKTVT